MRYPAAARRTARDREPTWEIARLFPAQGSWTEEDYLALEGNRLVELSGGTPEVLPMPTTSHQLVVSFLYRLLLAHVSPRCLGIALFAPIRIRLEPGKFREPDVVFMLHKNRSRVGEDYWESADLVMEVVSGDARGRRRDLITKRREYARAGIREYWIVDPEPAIIRVLKLSGKRYLVHGDYMKGRTAFSQLLPGFSVAVDDVFNAGKRPGA